MYTAHNINLTMLLRPPTNLNFTIIYLSQNYIVLYFCDSLISFFRLLLRSSWKFDFSSLRIGYCVRKLTPCSTSTCKHCPLKFRMPFNYINRVIDLNQIYDFSFSKDFTVQFIILGKSHSFPFGQHAISVLLYFVLHSLSIFHWHR